MQHVSRMLPAADGSRRYTCSWLPDDAPVASIVVVHGVAEHCGRHEPLAHYLAGCGFAVHAYDLRGHGRSDGPRAFIDRFEDHEADLARIVARVREEAPGLPLGVFGHSMGGAVALRHALQHPADVDALVLSSPMYRLGADVSPLLQALSTWIGRLAPHLPTVRLDRRLLSRDPEVVRQAETDPLNYHGRIPARTGAEFVRVTRELQDAVGQLRVPLLVIHGGADRLTDPQGSRDLYARAGSTDKTLRVFDGLFHETLNEPERETVRACIAQWLEERLGGYRSSKTT